jgi:hypothetical protein
MKIRQGFVSNSSSSSFLIYGACLNSKEMKLLKESFTEEQKEDIDAEGDWYVTELFSDDLLDIKSVMGEEFYIGRSWDSIKDDETGKQFKESVETRLKELLGDGTMDKIKNK